MLPVLELALEPSTAERILRSCCSTTASIRASRRPLACPAGCVLALKLAEVVSASGPCMDAPDAPAAVADAGPDEVIRPASALLADPWADDAAGGPEVQELVGLLGESGDPWGYPWRDPEGNSVHSLAASATALRPSASATQSARASLRVWDLSGWGASCIGCEPDLGGDAGSCWCL